MKQSKMLNGLPSSCVKTFCWGTNITSVQKLSLKFKLHRRHCLQKSITSLLAHGNVCSVYSEDNCPEPCGKCTRQHNSWRKGEEIFKFKCLLKRGASPPTEPGLSCGPPQRRGSFDGFSIKCDRSSLLYISSTSLYEVLDNFFMTISA